MSFLSPPRWMLDGTRLLSVANRPLEKSQISCGHLVYQVLHRTVNSYCLSCLSLDLFQAPERMPAPEALLPVPKCLNDPLGLLSEPSRSTCLAKFSFFVFTSFSNSILNFKIAYPEGRYAQWANTCLTWASPGCHLQH